MKVIKSLIFILVLAAVTYAGDIPQFDPGSTLPGEMPQFGSTPLHPGEMPQVGPSAANQKATNDAMAKILVAVIQNLVSLR